MYATYLINASKIWLLLYCTHQFIDKRKEKNLFHVQNCPCGTVSVKIDYVLGFFMQGKVVVEFGRKVFLVDSSKTPSATIQGNITAMRYRNECKSGYDVGT